MSGDKRWLATSEGTHDAPGMLNMANDEHQFSQLDQPCAFSVNIHPAPTFPLAARHKSKHQAAGGGGQNCDCKVGKNYNNSRRGGYWMVTRVGALLQM